MSGLFGFVNFEKEGPGVSKDAPKKRIFVVFFETYFRNFWKFISINIFYRLFSIPILTFGLGACGITNVSRNIARDKHSFGLSDFFETIKKNWKQGIAASIVNTIIYLLIFYNILFFFYAEKSASSTIFLALSLSALVIFTIMNYYIWTMIITFKLKLKHIYINSFKFVFLNLKRNLVCFISLFLMNAAYIVVAAVVYKDITKLIYILTIELIVYVLTYPGFKYLLVQYATFPAIKKFIIDPYYKEHPDEDIEKRRDLGLEVDMPAAETEYNTDSDENVFED